MHKYDVIIIGAGPAGGLSALDCARRGLRVLLCERRPFPRWKVCGCCFNAQAQAILSSMGLEALIPSAGGQILHRLHLGLRCREATFPIPPGFVLSRERFDQVLIDAARQAGAEVRFEVTAQMDVVQSDYRVVHLKDHRNGGHMHVEASVVVIAAGLSNRCLPQSEAGQIRIQRNSKLGAGCVIADNTNDYANGVIHMAIGQQGYVGLVRREDGLLNIAGAFSREALAEERGPSGAGLSILKASGFPVPALLQSHQHSWQCTPALSRQSEVVAGHRFFVLGDAAGYVEPFTGEGMAWALTAGAAVAVYVEAGTKQWNSDLERRWKQTLQTLIGRRQIVCRTLSFILNYQLPTLALFELIKRWPSISDPILFHLNSVNLPNNIE